MASSYTTLLKFNKPALGDPGWGTAINGGFTDMVEQALTGALSVAVTSGGVTPVPPIADGATSDARNQFITITGSLTSVQTATVQLPVGTSTNFKLYFVKNSAGGTVTVTTATGTNVAVPNGASMILRVTNAGVETTMTYATTLAIGTLTLTNALGATAGGTGQASYAVGDLLYASSTTALSKLTVGATDAVLTVAAGIPTWTNTLGIASGGTGQTTAATAFDALKQAATDAYTGVVELATNAESLAGTDTTRPITPASMRAGFSATGNAPVFAARAWINFYGVPTGGTYSRTGTLVTVNMTAHGMSTGMVANLTFSAGTGGTATSGSYTITSTGLDSFTVTDTASGSISGSPSVTRNTYIRASGNVTSLTTNGTGVYTVNFATALPDNYYTVSGAGYSGAGGYAIVQIEGNNIPSASSCRIATVTQQSGAPSGYNFDWVTVVFVR